LKTEIATYRAEARFLNDDVLACSDMLVCGGSLVTEELSTFFYRNMQQEQNYTNLLMRN
jgi:hypothetical protein